MEDAIAAFYADMNRPDTPKPEPPSKTPVAAVETLLSSRIETSSSVSAHNSKRNSIADSSDSSDDDDGSWAMKIAMANGSTIDPMQDQFDTGGDIKKSLALLKSKNRKKSTKNLQQRPSTNRSSTMSTNSGYTAHQTTTLTAEEMRKLLANPVEVEGANAQSRIRKTLRDAASMLITKRKFM